MILYSVWFSGPSNQYGRLARVLDMTAKEHCPSWDVVVEEIEPPTIQSQLGTTALADNHWKLSRWTRFVLDAPDGAEVLLVDSDMFVTRDLSAMWDIVGDLGITYREGVDRYPINGGVIAVRVSDRTKGFMCDWLRVDRDFFENPDQHRPWRRRYGGMNQSSLGYMLERPDVAALDVDRLPCKKWNCEDTSWAQFGPETRLVHVKSALRMACFGVGPRTPGVAPLAQIWKGLDKRANQGYYK